MLFTMKNLTTAIVMCIVMALTLFLLRWFNADVELTIINLVP